MAEGLSGDGMLDASGQEAISQARYEIEHEFAELCALLPDEPHSPAPGFYRLMELQMLLDDYKRAVDGAWARVFRAANGDQGVAERSRAGDPGDQVEDRSRNGVE